MAENKQTVCEEQPDIQNDSKTPDSEEYAYLDRGGFSSEKFKIEMRGLPKYYGIAVRILHFRLYTTYHLIYNQNK